jgi:hypothetical protein
MSSLRRDLLRDGLALHFRCESFYGSAQAFYALIVVRMDIDFAIFSSDNGAVSSIGPTRFDIVSVPMKAVSAHSAASRISMPM